MVIVAGFHLFPFRTEKLSPPAPMVLHTRGRVGSRRFFREPLELTPEALFIYMAVCSPTGEWASGAAEGRLNVFPCPSEGSEFPLATE